MKYINVCIYVAGYRKYSTNALPTQTPSNAVTRVPWLGCELVCNMGFFCGTGLMLARYPFWCYQLCTQASCRINGGCPGEI